MTAKSIPAALAAFLQSLVPASGPLARSVWCRKQRRRLRVPGHSVVWVRGQEVPWAKWGARRGFFDVQYMDGLPYLRALGAA
jgi:hypothetical protein